MDLKSDQDTQDDQAGEQKTPARPRAGMADFFAGEKKEFKRDLQPYLPQDMIGGMLPHIQGMEDEAVWNAASEGCGTEKVHYAYSIEGGYIWYLACPSASFASNPDSWCPLAAALPGNSEFWDRETVYLYEQEGTASALRWDPETSRMQVFLGASRTILPRVQSMDTNFVTINSEIADVVPWRNKMLRTEKLSRAVVRTLILSGLVVNLIAMAILVINLISIGFLTRDMESIKQQTDKAALELMQNANSVMQSNTIKHMVRVQQLLDSLASSNGYLVSYEVQGKNVKWSALVSDSLASEAIEDTTLREITNGRIRTYAPKTDGLNKDGKVRINGKK
ncbi:MAG: hypothetical protein ACRBCK_03350 [Alphaproteobacteria bacterium]